MYAIVSENELYHWGKGKEAKKHKYVERKMVNGNWVYIYPEDLKKKANKVKEEAEKKAKDAAEKIEKAKKKAEKAKKKVEKSVSELAKKGKDKLNSVLNKNNLKKKKVGAIPPVLIAIGIRLAIVAVAVVAKLAINAISKKLEQKYQKELKDSIKDKQEEKQYKYLAKVKTKNGWRYFYDQAELDAYYKNHGTETEKVLLNKYGLKDKPSTPEEDDEQINEKYNGDKSPEYANNCYSCSLAYDLRRKGYDVDSIPDYDGEPYENIFKLYKNSEDNIYLNNGPVTPKYCADTMKQIAFNEGDGSYGYVLLDWKGNQGSHSMVWEVIDNEFYIRDTQSNKLYSGDDIEIIMSYTSCTTEPGAMMMYRTDNAEFTDEVLKYVQKN